MAQIQIVATGALITVLNPPVWVNGIWECGDQRFTDQSKTLYQVPTAAAALPMLTPVQFYTSFTAQEMIAIKGSSDPLVKEFFARYQIALGTNTPINPNLISVQEGLSYLASPVLPGPGAGILASTTRIAQILAGTPQ